MMKIEIEIPDDKVDLLRKLCQYEKSALNKLNNQCVHWFYEGVQDALDKKIEYCQSLYLQSARRS